jgi:2-desacetyl-2-hydroxyethyl bacteriochlorophyllide A dehydrogenase
VILVLIFPLLGDSDLVGEAMMKRLVINGPRKAEFEDLSIPTCHDDGLLIQAEATAISTGTEIRAYKCISVDGKGELLYPNVPMSFPFENGYSMVGRVVEVGRLAEGFDKGDRVFVPEPHKEYTSVATRETLKLPESVLTEHAVFLSILGVGQLALRKGSPELGQNIAVVGLGVIGLATVALCQTFKFPVLGIDTDGHRLELAGAMGIDVISPEDSNFQRQVLEWSGGRGADLVIEAASTWHAVRTAMDVAREGGTIVVVSRHTDKPDFSPVNHPYFGKDLKLLTSYGYADDRWDRMASMRLMLNMLETGDLAIGPMITHEFEWTEIPEVYHRLDEGDSELLGVIIRWTEGQL